MEDINDNYPIWFPGKIGVLDFCNLKKNSKKGTELWAKLCSVTSQGLARQDVQGFLDDNDDVRKLILTQ